MEVLNKHVKLLLKLEAFEPFFFSFWGSSAVIRSMIYFHLAPTCLILQVSLQWMFLPLHVRCSWDLARPGSGSSNPSVPWPNPPPPRSASWASCTAPGTSGTSQPSWHSPGRSSGPGCTGKCQIWSLTQLYSVDFSPSSTGVKKCVCNKRTIKVCVSCSWRCPGTSLPSASHLTVSLYLCSSGSNGRGESRTREGRRVSSKSPSRVRDRDEGVAGRNGRE